jgi:putative two-component system response regulator
MEKMIFVVDDNDANLALAASALEEEFKVLTMPGAAKMFMLLGKKRPDLILLDIEMPETNGFEALARLKENPDLRDIPVVFLTGRDDEGFEEKTREAPVLDVIKKPFSPGELLERVRVYVN